MQLWLMLLIIVINNLKRSGYLCSHFLKLLCLLKQRNKMLNTEFSLKIASNTFCTVLKTNVMVSVFLVYVTVYLNYQL